MDMAIDSSTPASWLGPLAAVVHRPGEPLSDAERRAKHARTPSGRPPKVQNKFPRVDNPWKLTGCEFHVADRFVRQVPDAQIAVDMHCTVRTVQTILSRVRVKMGADKRAGVLIAWARHFGGAPVADTQAMRAKDDALARKLRSTCQRPTF